MENSFLVLINMYNSDTKLIISKNTFSILFKLSTFLHK